MIMFVFNLLWGIVWIIVTFAFPAFVLFYTISFIKYMYENRKNK